MTVCFLIPLFIKWNISEFDLTISNFMYQQLRYWRELEVDVRRCVCIGAFIPTANFASIVATYVCKSSDLVHPIYWYQRVYNLLSVALRYFCIIMLCAIWRMYSCRLHPCHMCITFNIFFFRNDIDVDNPQHEQYASNLLTSLIQELETKASSMNTEELFLTKLKLMEAANMFRVSIKTFMFVRAQVFIVISSQFKFSTHFHKSGCIISK